MTHPTLIFSQHVSMGQERKHNGLAALLFFSVLCECICLDEQLGIHLQQSLQIKNIETLHLSFFIIYVSVDNHTADSNECSC